MQHHCVCPISKSSSKPSVCIFLFRFLQSPSSYRITYFFGLFSLSRIYPTALRRRRGRYPMGTLFRSRASAKGCIHHRFGAALSQKKPALAESLR